MTRRRPEQLSPGSVSIQTEKDHRRVRRESGEIAKMLEGIGKDDFEIRADAERLSELKDPRGVRRLAEAIARTRTLNREPIGFEEHGFFHWEEDVNPQKDPTFRVILQNAWNYKNQGSKTPQPPESETQKGLTMWCVGHNSSHVFYLGFQDGKYYRSSYDTMHEEIITELQKLMNNQIQEQNLDKAERTQKYLEEVIRRGALTMHEVTKDEVFNEYIGHF